MNQDDAALNEILSTPSGAKASKKKAMVGTLRVEAEEIDDGVEKPERHKLGNLIQWTTSNGKTFLPASHTRSCLSPGVYEIQHDSQAGTYFEKIPVKTEGLLRFPQTNSDKVVKEIHNFWEKQEIFEQYKLTYKRGIILWGPPGSGKSCTIQLIMKDVIDRKGIVIKFVSPGLFLEGIRILREIQPNTPIVVLMEDIDAIVDRYCESDVLNILDGVDQVEKVVFLATTNYPQNLGARILNRPSRFDKRFFIDHPNAESRKIYLSHLIGAEKIKELNINLDDWVRHTDGFSIAHLKELFVAVVILGDGFKQAIETLASMKENIEYSEKRPMGFSAKNNRFYAAE